MKWICYFFLVTLCISCTKDQTAPEMPIYLPGDLTHGHATMEKNGVLMTASAIGMINVARRDVDSTLIELRCYTYSKSGDTRESILFGYFPLKEDRYVIPYDQFSEVERQRYTTFLSLPPRKYGLRTSFEDCYSMDTSYTNAVTIFRVDTIENVLQGRFQARFVAPQPKKNPANPDTVTFSNGVFDTEFYEF